MFVVVGYIRRNFRHKVIYGKQIQHDDEDEVLSTVDVVDYVKNHQADQFLWLDMQ